MEFFDSDNEKIPHISPIKLRRLKKTLKILMSPIPQDVEVIIRLNYFEIDEFGVELLADVYHRKDNKTVFHEEIQTFAG